MMVSKLLLKNVFHVTGVILNAGGTQRTRRQTLLFQELNVLGVWTDTNTQLQSNGRNKDRNAQRFGQYKKCFQ